MAITVSSVYALDMPKDVYIQLSGQQGVTAVPPLKIRADKIKAGAAGRMTLTIGNETIKHWL